MMVMIIGEKRLRWWQPEKYFIASHWVFLVILCSDVTFSSDFLLHSSPPLPYVSSPFFLSLLLSPSFLLSMSRLQQKGSCWNLCGLSMFPQLSQSVLSFTSLTSWHQDSLCCNQAIETADRKLPVIWRRGGTPLSIAGVQQLQGRTVWDGTRVYVSLWSLIKI